MYMCRLIAERSHFEESARILHQQRDMHLSELMHVEQRAQHALHALQSSGIPVETPGANMSTQHSDRRGGDDSGGVGEAEHTPGTIGDGSMNTPIAGAGEGTGRHDSGKEAGGGMRTGKAQQQQQQQLPPHLFASELLASLTRRLFQQQAELQASERAGEGWAAQEDELKSLVAKREGEIEQKVHQLSLLHAKEDAVSKDVAELQAIQHELKFENESLKSKVVEAREDCDALKKRLAHSEENQRALTVDNTGMEKMLATEKQDKDRLARQVHICKLHLLLPP